jgi:hypothetical protein
MTNLKVESKKQKLVSAVQAELKRIGASTQASDSFDIGLDFDGRIAAADNSGYYACKNYRTLLADLKDFADNSITDADYDGSDSHIWSDLWSLFLVY